MQIIETICDLISGDILVLFCIFMLGEIAKFDRVQDFRVGVMCV